VYTHTHSIYIESIKPNLFLTCSYHICSWWKEQITPQTTLNKQETYQQICACIFEGRSWRQLTSRCWHKTIKPWNSVGVETGFSLWKTNYVKCCLVYHLEFQSLNPWIRWEKTGPLILRNALRRTLLWWRPVPCCLLTLNRITSLEVHF
jgi:hypothetical protein